MLIDIPLDGLFIYLQDSFPFNLVGTFIDFFKANGGNGNQVISGWNKLYLWIESQFTNILIAIIPGEAEFPDI